MFLPRLLRYQRCRYSEIARYGMGLATVLFPGISARKAWQRLRRWLGMETGFRRVPATIRAG